MRDAIVVLNAGSSSLKACVYALDDDALTPFLRGRAQKLLTEPDLELRDPSGVLLEQQRWAVEADDGHRRALELMLELIERHAREYQILAIGHRVVHGGDERRPALRVDEGLLGRLEALVPLAPLHQPHNLAPIRLVGERWPRLAQVACFDTAFHAAQPTVARLFALPAALVETGVRRYGFHGLSYEYIAGVLPALDERAAEGRTVVMHLGNGASMCALQGGQSRATTMGFTALDGLPMGTRCGSLDPGVLLYLMQRHGMDAQALQQLLYHESGLLGISGLSNDMRVLLASDAPAARQAVEYFVYRAGRELGSLAAALGGLDAIVFTAGIGEHAAVIRERICAAAAWLGVVLDDPANARGGPRISATASAVSVWVIPTDEELAIARHARRVIADEAAA